MESTLLYESQKSKIFVRKRDEKWNQSTVLKVLNYEYPSPSDIAHFYNEQEILDGLNLNGVRHVLERTKDHNRHAMVLEWVEGENIHEAFRQHRSDIGRFLRTAIALTETLAGLHQHNIIHKDISSTNVIANLEKGSVCLIDFGIATNLDLKHTYLGNPERLEGNLRYISPEQSGRMNRIVDFRSDLYSLGVVLYETLAGVPPFTAKDAMELIHAHIAHTPAPLSEVNPAVPEQISRIVGKLLAKNAEDRYQSAVGVKADLERCLREWEQSKKIEHFPLASVDFSGKFIISQKLYGRENEIEQILNAFHECAAGKLGLMTVGGYSGTGKSALVNEVHKPITEKRGYFASGKFDQFQRAVPYSAFIDAFKELISILLTEPEAKLAEYKHRIQEALGEEGQVLTNVVPTLEYIIGEQPPLPEVGGAEAQSRFNYVVRKFVHALCTPEHPVVLFIDDLQWADAASLNLLNALMDDTEGAYLLCICAYRDNEVSTSHPFMLLVNDLQKKVPIFRQITIGNLALNDIESLIAASLGQEQAAVGELAALVHEKTHGNAFFVTQFLKSLAEERLLTFDYQSYKWQWDVQKIREKNITDNVVELMASKVLRLPAQTQEIIKLGACLGSSFDVATLLLVSDFSEEDVLKNLKPALKEGMAFPLGKHIYKFSHDRIQQAVYSLLSDEQRVSTHIRIGRLLRDKFTEEERENRLFDVVNHLNTGSALITNAAEQEELAALNIKAAKKSRENSAFDTALQYAETSLRLLTNDAWKSQYELALAAHTEATEAAYLSGDIEKMDGYFQIILSKAQNILEKVKPYEIRILGYKAENKLHDAIRVGLEVLEQLGEPFPKKPNLLFVAQGLISTALSLRKYSDEQIYALPLMTDPYKRAAMRIIAGITSSIYWASPNLFPLVVFRMVSLTLKYGNHPVTCFALGTYGVIMCGVLGAMRAGYKYSNLALTLLDKIDAKEWKAQVYCSPYALIVHWNRHVEETLIPLRDSFQIGMETGLVEFSCINSNIYCIHSFLMGKPLERAEEETKSFSQSYFHLQQMTNFNYNEVYRQAMLNFLGRSENPLMLVGEAYDEVQMSKQNLDRADKTGQFFYNFNKSIVSYYFQDFENAHKFAGESEKLLEAVLAKFEVPNHAFYRALSATALYPTKSGFERVNLLRIARKYSGKLKTWAKTAPENFLHKHILIQADIARVTGKIDEARVGYDSAIALANKHGYLHEAALGYELAGAMYVGQKATDLATFYLKSAYNTYREWGAAAKLRDLEQRYSTYISSVNTAGASLLQTVQAGTTTASTSRFASGALDMGTILKASTTISGEVVFSRLLGVMMRIVMENAGAQRGILLLEDNGELWIQAQRTLAGATAGATVGTTAGAGEGSETLDLERIAFKSANAASNLMPESIVQFVQRSKKVVVVDNAEEDKRFNSDGYILAQKPQSVLCLPILNQGKLLGILYLEHRSTTGAFTSNRVELLSLLSGQIAVSLTNSLAYEQLEQKVAERTQELAREKKNIEIANGELSERNEQLHVTMNNLKQTQSQLVQAEKMASLGVLTAGVAHEINNPINFISGSIPSLERNVHAMIATLDKFNEIKPEKVSSENIEEIRTTLRAIHDEQQSKRLPKMMSQVPTLFTAINGGAERVIEIVRGLQSFSRLDENALKMMSVQEGIDSTLVILQSQFKERGVHVEKNYGAIPEVECFPGQINQVFMNVLANALYAIPKEKSDGIVHISTEIAKDDENIVEIHIRDNGIGMTEEIQKSIFDPFFTTKKVGEGTGLGLSIVLGIIEKHHGTITVQSAPNEGADFCVRLPLKQVRQSAN